MMYLWVNQATPSILRKATKVIAVLIIIVFMVGEVKLKNKGFLQQMYRIHL